MLIAGGISPLDLVASPRRRELVTYPLVGGAKAPLGELAAAAAGLQARQIAFPTRHNNPPFPLPALPSARPSSSSTGSSVPRHLCLALVFGGFLKLRTNKFGL